MSSRSLSDIQTRAEGKYQIKIGYVKHTFILNFRHELLMSILMLYIIAPRYIIAPHITFHNNILLSHI